MNLDSCQLGILVPEYHSYMGACVYHTSNSTFLSRGLYAAAYNYAAMDGNADITKGVVAYNVLTSSYCATNTASSLYTYNNLVNSMLSKNQSLQVCEGSAQRVMSSHLTCRILSLTQSKCPLAST